MSSKKIKRKKSPLWSKDEQLIVKLVKSGIPEDKLLQEATKALGLKKAKASLEGFLNKIHLMSGASFISLKGIESVIDNGDIR